MSILRTLVLSGAVAVPLLAQDPPPPPSPRSAPTPRPAAAPRPRIAPRPPSMLWAPSFPDEARLSWQLDAERMRADFEDTFAEQRHEWEANAARIADEARLQWGGRALEALAPLRGLGARLEPLGHELGGMDHFPGALTMTPRAAWARGDQGDSLYRRARELLNNGEYRRAAAAFRDLTTKTPNSTYAADALYWQAFALYRIGGTDELRTALEALEQQKSRYPAARMQSETETLGVRIRGALASRGDAASAAQLRSANADSIMRCDREEQSVRAEALNAITQSDPTGAMPVLQKTLARKDACSASLRRTAVFLIGSKRAEGSEAMLVQVARTDPSIDVRSAALEWLARFPGDGSLAVLEELARDTSARVQGAAVRALVGHPSPRARQSVRNLVERAETPERLRLEALSAFDKDRSSADDVAWMRTLYGRTENPRIRARLVSTLSNIGGPEVDQWLLALARDPEADSDTRRAALRRVGRTLPVPDLAKVYDASAERSVREGVIDILRERAEAEATDKLIEIVKRGTDPQLRSRAISALTSKKDPRTMRLLMEILDK